MKTMADDFLLGAIDLHVHGYPEIGFNVKGRLEDDEIAMEFKNADMGGFVLKSHMWPTVGRVYALKKRFPSLNIFSSITLNVTTGGLCPIAVESAAKQGAKVVFMPTWSAINDLKREGFSSYFKEYLQAAKNLKAEEGISIIDENGKLLKNVFEILEIAKEYNLVVATSHLSPSESLILAKEAQRVGGITLIFSHPDSRSVGASFEEMQQMVRNGAFIEICTLGLLPSFQRISPRDIIKTVRGLSSEKCFLSTDFFFDWAPPPPEMLRMTIGALLSEGLLENEIRNLVQLNPAMILGIET